MNEVEKKARHLLKAAGVETAPVDLERILVYLRLHHERPWHLSADVWSALTRPARGRTRLVRQEREATARSRWKLAHEIAHHVLHGAEPVRPSGQWLRNELEHEADQFAAEILMPVALVKKEAARRRADVEGVARTFKVGRQEMEKRLRQLGLLKAETLFRF